MSRHKSTDTFIDEINSGTNVAFFKPGCPFCHAAQELIDILVENKLTAPFTIYNLGVDFDNDTLLDVAHAFNWQPDGIQQYPTKPQIFVEGEFIGGNSEFYTSRWNMGEGMPQQKNPRSWI